MYHTRAITNDLYWVGGNDRRLALFESAYPIPRGVSYNSYIYKDEKNVLLDTVDAAVADAFFENIDHVLKGETIDYIIVNHMEPDHSATLGRVLRAYPNATVVCNKMLYAMIGQYFDVDLKDRVHFVAEGDTLCTGKHTFAFVMAPMVHWPEVMMTYEVSQKVLFSADAFGTFGAIGGSIFADEVHFERDWLDDARRYYTNIVGKYGTQVQNVLKKAQGLDIDYICPLHGPVWRDNIEWFVKKYDLWSSYKPETNGVLIAYSSVYGNTKNVAEILGGMLAKRGIKEMETYDVAVTHPSYLVSKAFEYSHIVFATTTYNAGIFVAMENLLHDIAAHNLQNRTIALIENGSWAPAAGQKMKELLQPLKGTSFVNDMFTIRSTMKADQMGQLEQLADSIMSTLPQPKPETDPAFKISYGLYILSANQNGKDNACIINTAQLVTSMPKKLCVTVNKSNYTHEMIDSTKRFNISVLTQTASFDIFKHFGFCSGRDVDKTTDYPGAKRSANGLLYFTKCCNAFISVKVTQQVDCGSHTMFIGDVEEEEVFSSAPSVTYTYYQQHIKPAPKAAESKKKGFVCKICGYVYEGDVLPADFICPICKHPASDFEPLG